MSPETCPICGGRLVVRFAHLCEAQSGARFDVLACEQCGLGITSPQPTDTGGFYGAGYYGGRHSFTAGLCIRRRLRWASRFAAARRRLLDVGCGDGSFLVRASQQGWSVAGTELAPAAARVAGLTVGRSLDDVRDAAPFDVVTLWHSLEHMPEPARVVAEIRTVLAPGGAVLVAVPDFGGWQAHLTGRAWLHADVPRHLFHFTAASLTRLLTGAGLRPTHFWHCEFEYDLLGWSQSVMNAFLAPPNAFFDLLRGEKSVSRGKAILHLGVGTLLSVLALPLVPLGAAFSRGGTLVVAART